MTAILFENNEYVLEAQKGLPENVRVLTSLSISDLAMMHNLILAELRQTIVKDKVKDIKPVNKFADKASGAKRVWALLQHFAVPAKSKPAAAPAPKEAPKKAAPADKAERKKRGQRFVFPVGDELKSVRPGTNRAKLIEMLSGKGATFEECMAATWGQNKAMSPEIQHKTTYEGIRLLHYYVGYGMKHDMETGIIRIYR